MSAPTCQYYIRGDRGQEPHGVPATHYWMDSTKRFYLCTTHARAVSENTNRKTHVYEIPEALREEGARPS